jgi:hypothetical protein
MMTLLRTVKDILSTPFYGVFAVCALLFIGCVEYLGASYGFTAKVNLFAYDRVAMASLVMFTVFCFFAHLLYVLIMARPASPLSRLFRDYKSTVTAERMMHALVLFCMYAPFFASYTYFKTMIPHMVPFQYDEAFAKIDKALHLGFHPWQIMQPLLGYAVVTFAVSILYKFWFLAKFFVMYWQAFARTHLDLRAQFFLTLLFSWVINGALFALLLSSAGPCFYDVFVADGAANPYAGLMDYLRSVNEIYPVVHLDSQAFLMDVYRADNPRVFSGISAMPSMHMSVAMAVCLLCWQYGRIARFLGALFLLVTFLGSVHLAWHYAIDGYFAMITTFLIWRICGWAVKRYNLSEPRMKKAA